MRVGPHPACGLGPRTLARGHEGMKKHRHTYSEVGFR